MSHRKEIRVFVSSPGDCDAVARVLDEMNRTVGAREHLFFQLVCWEDLPPGQAFNLTHCYSIPVTALSRSGQA